MVERYQTGNAQFIGRREIQSNYFSMSNNNTGELFVVLADGTIDHPNGRRAAVMAVEYCVNSFAMTNAHTMQFLSETALRTNRHIQDEIYLDKSPRLSLTLCLFAGKNLQYFNVGVNRICLYSGHGERILGGDTYSAYSIGGCMLSLKDTIGIFTAGVYANASPMERIKIVASKKKAFDKAQIIIASVKEKDLDNQMNATALLIEVAK